MWRKEQHFIATRKHSNNNARLLDNGDGVGPWCEKQISDQPLIKLGQGEWHDGCRMYGGHEFDIFGSTNISVLSNDDEQWHSMRLVSSINATANSRTVTQRHTDLMKANSMKRKTEEDERSTVGMMEKKSKYCRSGTTTSNSTLDSNYSRPSILRTHFFLHTTPSGAPVDLFKPMVDSSNFFCTQHTIYS